MSKNRKSRTRNWAGRQSRDVYVRKARDAGYASRAAFKLEEIDRREKIFKQGVTVIDLGAAPGSWSQYAVSRVGSTGRVIAVDRDEVLISGVTTVCGDICAASTLIELKSNLSGNLADIVMSDMAPDITGVRDVDEAHFEHLLLAVEQVIDEMLRPGGKLIVKLFQGTAADAFRQRIDKRFERISARKPASSRSKSREYFASCTGFRSKSASSSRLQTTADT